MQCTYPLGERRLSAVGMADDAHVADHQRIHDADILLHRLFHIGAAGAGGQSLATFEPPRNGLTGGRREGAAGLDDGRG